MAKSIRVATSLVIGATLILLNPPRVIAQGHPGLVIISAVSTLSSSELSSSEWRQWDALVDRMTWDGELVLRASYEDRLLPNRQHERLSQYYMGVPVYGGDISRQTARGVTVSIFGTVHTQIDLDPTPGLSADEAAVILENVSGATLVQSSPPRLTILPTLDGSYALTYRATLSNVTTYFVDAHTGQVLVEVDEVKTQSAVGRGEGVLGDAKKVSATRAAGAFRTQDQLRPAEILTLDTRGEEATLDRMIEGVSFDSDIATDSDNTWTDAGVVDAHVHTGWSYDYFRQRHGWAGLDDEDSRIFDVVNDFSVLPNNAFFVLPPFGPEGKGLVAFGETAQGTPITVLEIVAHEIMHGVTYFSVSRRTGDGLGSFLIPDGVGPTGIVLSGGQFVLCDDLVLVFSDGSTAPFFCSGGSFALASNHGGAIDEAFSDVFGTSVEFFFQEAGSGPLKADYLVGEDIPELGTLLRGQAGPIRSLESPQSLEVHPNATVPFPDEYSRRLRFAIVTTPLGLLVVPLVFVDGTPVFLEGIDNGAVHWNSTILSHAFYLAIEGGQNATSGRTVEGVGAANREDIERVFFRAMTDIMPSFSTLPLAAAVLCQSAVDLFGISSAVSRAVDQALLAVGL